MIFSTQEEFLQKIKQWKFTTNPLSKVVKNLEQIEKNTNLLKQLDQL